MKPFKWKVLNWTVKQLGGKERRYLAGLETTYRETLTGDIAYLMVHGSPISDKDTIYPSVTARGLRQKLDDERPDILVCGHTHIPFVKRLAGTLVVNCGSVGQAIDGDPRPSYALVRIARGVKSAGRIVRFSYPVREVVAAIERSTLPKYLVDDFPE
jgi:diadenosine tetraphosphatase ApaH/serine/threonine PP2A family protein phosphatase